MSLVGIAVAIVLGAGPLLLGLAGVVSERSATTGPATPWNWKLTVTSALLYTLAFNLIFFIQELFLVLPKALTPGLRPTLFHNNHTWEGDNPLASLFQGTGALATFLTAIVCTLLLRRGGGRSATTRLFLIWMAYNGFFQSVPQVVIGALNPGNDVGMAMSYFGLSPTAKTVAALVALAAIPAVGLGLTPPLLALAEAPGDIANARARTRFVFRVATLPAVIAIALIIPFRVPRDLIEVVLLPIVVAVIGISWIQAGAWRMRDVRVPVRVPVRTPVRTPVRAPGGSGTGSVAHLITAVLILFLVFQLLLRPGIHFY